MVSKFPEYETPLALLRTSDTDHLTWNKVKADFMKFAPVDEKGTEMPHKSSQPPSTGVANMAGQKTRPKEKRNYCQNMGHTEKECRQKERIYKGFSTPNTECKNWVNRGMCDWEENPLNVGKRPCRLIQPLYCSKSNR